ncbi:MAG: DUF2589 domain-containing protein [Eubacterium sp.]
MEWDEFVGGKPLIMDIGENRAVSGCRYAAWTPKTEGTGHEIAEVCDNLHVLQQKYAVADENILFVNQGKDNTSLPMDALVRQPLMEVAKGQAALCDIYLETLFRIVYENLDRSEKTQTGVLSFEYERPIEDRLTGVIKIQKNTINAPLLSVLPLPAFTMDEASVSFSMDVNMEST